MSSRRALELFISGTQWVDAFSGRLATHIDRLAARFAEASPEPKVATPPATVRSSSRWMWGAGAALAAAAAAIAILLAWPSNRPAQTTDQAPTADPSVISNPVKIQEPTDQVADKPSDPNLGTAETAPAGLCRSRRALGQSAGAQPAAPAEALPAPSMDGSRYGK